MYLMPLIHLEQLTREGLYYVYFNMVKKRLSRKKAIDFLKANIFEFYEPGS